MEDGRRIYHITRITHPEQNWSEAVLALRAGFDPRRAPEPFLSFIKRRLEAETTLLSLVWDGEKPIAYVLAFDVADELDQSKWTRVGYLAQFVIADGYRTGIGSLLMEYVDEWLESRGIDEEIMAHIIGQKCSLVRGFLPHVTRTEENWFK